MRNQTASFGDVSELSENHKLEQTFWKMSTKRPMTAQFAVLSRIVIADF